MDGDTVTPFSFTKSADGTRWNVVISDDVAEGDGEALATALNTTGIKNAAIASDDFEQTTSGGTTSATSGTVDPGYYLITSTLGTKLVLQTLNDVTINTKNEYITTPKTASKTNMEVGDNVTYTITVNIPATTKVGEEITVHDTLDTTHLAILDDNDEIAESAADYNITATIGTDGDAVTLSDGTAKSGETFAKTFTVTQAMIDEGSVSLLLLLILQLEHSLTSLQLTPYPIRLARAEQILMVQVALKLKTILALFCLPLVASVPRSSTSSVLSW